MSYIGREPQIGNFQICDAISVVNGQAAYTMQVGGANVSPETANHMIVSLNGIIQAPGSSYTVAGSTITFASNLATGDVINFIHILGSVLDLGVPSNDTVGAAQIKDDLISGTTALTAEPADTDEFLVSDAGTLKRIDYSLIKGGGNTVLLGESNITSATAAVTWDGLFTSDYPNYKIIMTDLLGSAPAQMRMRVLISGSENTSSNYYSAHISVQGSSGGGSADASREWGDSSWELLNASISNNSAEVSNFYVDLPNPLLASSKPTMASQHAVNVNNSSQFHAGVGGYFYNTATAISGVKIFQESGNITQGNFYLYGIKG